MDFRNSVVLALFGLAAVVLSGCATVAVPVFSEIPIALVEPCNKAQCSLPGAKESTQYGYIKFETKLGDRRVRSLVPGAVGHIKTRAGSGAPPEKALAFEYEGALDVKVCYCPLPL